MISIKSLSIATRFNLLNTILVLLTGLSIGLIVTYVQLDRQFQAQHQQGLALATLLAETSEYAVYTRQTTLLDRQFAQLQKVSDLAYAFIVDDKGVQLAQMQAHPEDTPPPENSHQASAQTLWQWWLASGQQRYIEIVHPITSHAFQDEDVLFMDGQQQNKTVIGQVHLGISLAYFKETVTSSLLLGLSVVVAILLLGMMISLSLTARITLPLKKLAESAHKVIEGNAQPLLLPSGGPELAELAQAHNLMIDWLADYRSEVEHYQSMLEQQAYYDELTGLANRTLLKKQLQLSLSCAVAQHKTAALLFLDLDRFKYVNDTLGHSFGDQLLAEVAQRLRATTNPGDIVARMGGDEFIIIINEMDGDIGFVKAAVGEITQQIGTALEQPFTIRGHNISTSFSIGIALCPQDAEDSETLIRFADCAMYEAKRQGRNTFHFYESCLQQQGERRLTLENNLKRAIERDELQLYFQPKYDYSAKRLVGAEALLRWHFADEWVSPIEFIPIAEETGLILSIGEWVMQTALAALREWRTLGVVDDDFHIGVNVASSQFWHHDFARRTVAILNQYLPGCTDVLELELTESCLLRSSKEIQECFKTLRQAGVRFAVDDFGTGYSSLSYLKQFPLNVLKIDQSFVRDCIDDPYDSAIIRAIIAMAHGLGLEVIAEGVETAEHVDFLTQEGCNLLQGYFLAKPMPSQAFIEYYRNFQVF
ncbi:hypothetical protein JCM14076_10110 [Methylosoma difficile]